MYMYNSTEIHKIIVHTSWEIGDFKDVKMILDTNIYVTKLQKGYCSFRKK